MGYRIAALVGALGLTAATALATATPLSPLPGAFIDPPAGPVFSWTVPANEQADAVYIADRPDTTTAGMFVEGNLIRAHSVMNGDTTWAPGAPLYAGRYWWLVSSHDRSTTEGSSSTPREFTIGLSFEFDRATVRRSLSQHWLRLTPHWKGNMHTVRFRISLLLRGRVIWASRGLRTNRVIGALNGVTVTWHRPRWVKQGTLLTLREGMSVPGSSAGGGVLSGVRAP